MPLTGLHARVEPLAAADHRRGRLAREGTDRRERPVNRLVVGAADGAAHPVDEGAQPLAAHLRVDRRAVDRDDPLREALGHRGGRLGCLLGHGNVPFL
jgi:hypothetical protein